MHRILVPVDGSSESLRAVVAARERAAAAPPGSFQIHLLNVQPRMTRRIGRFASSQAISGLQLERADRALDPARALLRSAGCEVRIAVRAGRLHACITEYATEQRVQEIVMVAARKTLLERMFTGSVLNQVIAGTPVPVTVVAGRRPGALSRFGLPAGVGAGLTALVLAID